MANDNTQAPAQPGEVPQSEHPTIRPPVAMSRDQVFEKIRASGDVKKKPYYVEGWDAWVLLRALDFGGLFELAKVAGPDLLTGGIDLQAEVINGLDPSIVMAEICRLGIYDLEKERPLFEGMEPGEARAFILSRGIDPVMKITLTLTNMSGLNVSVKQALKNY